MTFRDLLDVDLATLTVDVLVTTLDAAGDEDSMWEAKGRDVRDARHLQRAVARLANRDGGIVVLGIERDSGRWVACGVAGRPEPGTWIHRA